MALYSLHQAIVQQSLTWHLSQLNPAGDASAAVGFWTVGVWAVEGDSVTLGASTRGSERDLQVDRTWEVLSDGSVLPAPAREFAGPSLWWSSKVGLTCLTLSDEVMTVRSLNLAPKHWAASRAFWNACSLLLQQWFLLQAGIEKCMKKKVALTCPSHATASESTGSQGTLQQPAGSTCSLDPLLDVAVCETMHQHLYSCPGSWAMPGKPLQFMWSPAVSKAHIPSTSASWSNTCP